MPAATLNTDQLATLAFLSGVNQDGTIAAKSYWSWNNDNPATYTNTSDSAHKWNNDGSGNTLATSSVAGTASGTITYAFNTANNITAAQQQAFTACLTLWSDETNVTFAQIADNTAADVLLSVATSGGTYDQGSPITPGAAGSSAIPADLTPGANGGQGAIVFDNSGGFGTLASYTDAGGYSYDALLHEIGHLIGLGHSGPYNDGNGNAGSNLAPSLQNTQYDSRQWSLMSYIDPDDTTAANFSSYTYKNTNWGGAVPETPMVLDILAAQRLYGAPVTTALSGGQVFGFNCNITDASKQFFTFSSTPTSPGATFAAPVVTLWDAGGNNTLNLSGYSTADVVNLNQGTYSSVDGLTNNIGIALNTAIDSLVAGTGNDTITVNGDNDTITGGGGTDTVVFAGASSQYVITRLSPTVITVADTIAGRNGTDTLTGIRYLQFADTTLDTTSISAKKTNDFNGDGKSDILFQNTNGSVAIWQMNGASVTASALVISPGTAWHAVGAGDFNGDGKADILFQNENGSVYTLQMNGTALVAGALIGTPDPSWHVLGTGDFNGDGKSDILFQNNNGGVAIWEMNGASLVASALVGSPDPSWHVVSTGDFNGDGKSDILFQNDDGRVYIWQMNGTSMTAGALVGSPDPSWHAIGTGDFNGDGKSDILFQNNNGSIAIWQMNGGSITASALVSNPGPAWHPVSVGDYNGDGKSDILFQNDNGSVYVWEMNGTSVAAAAPVGSPPIAWQALGLNGMHFINATQSTGSVAGTNMSDDFVFTSLVAGAHVITGFDPAHDVITLNQTQFGSYAAVQQNESQVSGAAVINLGGGSTLTIAGVLPAALAAKNFV